MSATERSRVGIIASDPLRALGLMSILESAGMEAFVARGLDEVRAEGDEDPEAEPMEALVLDARIASTAAASSAGPAAEAADALKETIGRLRRERPGLKIVVMDKSTRLEHVQSVIAAGAKGYLAETAGEAEIRMALEVVLDGSIWAPRKVLARLIEEGGGQAEEVPAVEPVAGKMSPREADVLEILLRGGSNRDIAGELGIDEVTVKAHLGRMLRKTGASNRVELTLRALEERRAAEQEGLSEIEGIHT